MTNPKSQVRIESATGSGEGCQCLEGPRSTLSSVCMKHSSCDAGHKTKGTWTARCFSEAPISLIKHHAQKQLG